MTREELTPEVIKAVLRLVELSQDSDGITPLSEQAILRVRHANTRPIHLVARWQAAESREDDQDEVVGYLILEPGVDERAGDLVAELVVDPEHRNRGIGQALLEAALGEAELAPGAATTWIWAHGDRPDAAVRASHLGFTRERILLQMRRSTAEPLPTVSVPDGVRVRTFRPGADDEAWVALNARAFAGHPEQQFVTVEDLRERQQESWFDPDGFFLAERVDDGRVIGFHWTKVHERPERVGEVYVVGLDPVARGTGLGLALTVIGLEYLASLGLADVILYADETNAGAVRMYERLGFVITNTDVEYARRIGGGERQG